MTQWGLDALFNPAKRHMDEEKRRLQSTRSEVGDNSGGKRIDLESGKVVIGKRDEDGAEAESPSDASNAEPRDGASAAASKGKSKAASKKDGDAKGDKLSPAAERAAKRRARSTP